MTRFAPASSTCAGALDGVDAAADLARQALRNLCDERGVVALAHGRVEIDQLDERKLARISRSSIRSRQMRGAVFRPAQAGRCGRPEDRWKESAWQPHGNAGLRQFLFERARARNAEVKDAGGERGIGFAARKDIGEMGDGARAARGDDGNADRLADGGGEFAIEAGARAVGVHRGEQDFAGAAGFGFARPLHDATAGRLAAALHEDLRIAHGIGGIGSRRASMATTTACAPKLRPMASISVGSASAAELMLTLSAPASKTCSASSALRMPPPTQKGTKSSRAVRRTVSSSVWRPSWVAVMSSRTISSAPSRAWRAASSAGSPASMRSTNCTPLTTRPCVHVEAGDDALGQHAAS